MSKQVLIPELLSPAGSMECLEAAVLYGADAVYLAGKQFGMRTSPENFSQQALVQAVKYCHNSGVKVYMTLNTLPRGEEIDMLPEFIKAAVAAGVDALIVADIGVMMLIKRIAPDIELHISTQAGIVNHLTATELYHLGASRVVLARELSLAEICIIRENTPPDLAIEAFVHGAMCVSFSGRCLLSQYMNARDGNRGNCSQPCRWKYHIIEERRPGQYMPVYEDESGSYIFNAQDLCMIEYIDQLAKAGISSFKIEGRAKSPYYVAVTSGAYRAAIDIYRKDPDHFDLPEWLREEVRKVSHREYCTGFYFGDQPGQCHSYGGYVRQWEIVASVEGWANGQIHCVERNRFAVGEELELIRPGKRAVMLTVTSIEDEEGNFIEVANHPMAKLKIPFSKPCPAGSMLRRATR